MNYLTILSEFDSLTSHFQHFINASSSADVSDSKEAATEKVRFKGDIPYGYLHRL
jgi:hypothetical protein